MILPTKITGIRIIINKYPGTSLYFKSINDRTIKI
jgi:hypothetical protein